MANGTLTTATKQFSEEVLINRVLINRDIQHPDDVIDVTLVGSPGASKEESVTLDATKNNLFDTRYTFTEYHATYEVQLYIENGGNTTPLVESVSLIEDTRNKDVTGLTWTANDLDALAQEKNNVVYNNTSDLLVLDNTIPDSVIQQFDPRAESIGSTSTLTDKLGFADLSGSVEVISSGINGLQTYRFDGSTSNTASHTTTISTSDPVAVVMVVQQQEAPESNSFYLDGGSEFEFAIQDDNDGTQYATYRGTTSTELGGLPAPDTDPHLITIEGVNSDELRLTVDGSGGISGALSAAGLTGLKLAGAVGRDDLNLQVDFGQVEVLNNYSQDDLNAVEQRLQEDWNV